MADILIRGMEIPKNCSSCKIVCWNYLEYGINGILGKLSTSESRDPNCPLVPLPEGHGDLIDRDNVLLDIDCTGTNKFGMLDEDIRAFLRRYKPIVPAEGGTE